MHILWRPQRCCLAEDRYHVPFRNISCRDQFNSGYVQPVTSNYFWVSLHTLKGIATSARWSADPAVCGKSLGWTQPVLEAFVCSSIPLGDAWAYEFHSGNESLPHADYSEWIPTSCSILDHHASCTVMSGFCHQVIYHHGSILWDNRTQVCLPSFIFKQSVNNQISLSHTPVMLGPVLWNACIYLFDFLRKSKHIDFVVVPCSNVYSFHPHTSLGLHWTFFLCYRPYICIHIYIYVYIHVYIYIYIFMYGRQKTPKWPFETRKRAKGRSTPARVWWR